ALDDEIKRSAEKESEFAKIPSVAQERRSTEFFRKLTDASGRPDPVCAVCGRFTKKDCCLRFSLNDECPADGAPMISSKLLQRVQTYCCPDEKLGHLRQRVREEHKGKPGLQLLEGLALQWRYRSDDYKTWLIGGVDEQLETLSMCKRCYAHLTARKC
ncbi:hypothetical protein, partial [Lactiplantibacillus mudanjiangensis]|uniref:hypothetical protein n=1 Tax=Lactiplantibacillus mudanjiangensis TaxID=1296538 RepID=UPI001CDC1207